MRDGGPAGSERDGYYKSATIPTELVVIYDVAEWGFLKFLFHDLQRDSFLMAKEVFPRAIV
jgi:hypothetical protein